MTTAKLLAFDKAKTVMERWLVIETMAHFLNSQECVVFTREWQGGMSNVCTADDTTPDIDDGKRVSQTIGAIGCAFLTMLDQLEREGLLTPDSEIRDIPLVHGLGPPGRGRIRRREGPRRAGAALGRAHRGVCEEEQDRDCRAGRHRARGQRQRHGRGVADAAGQIGGQVGLEEGGAFNAIIWPVRGERALTCNQQLAALKMYGKLGGDRFDITKWSRQERARHAFDKKDPLPDDVVKALKEGADVILR